jgi:hypothetical protein
MSGDVRGDNHCETDVGDCHGTAGFVAKILWLTWFHSGPRNRHTQSAMTPPETVGRVRREETSLDDVSIKAARDRLHHRARIKVEIGIVNT